MTTVPTEIKLADYRQPNYWTKHVDLEFDLTEDEVIVISECQYALNPGFDKEIELNGLDLDLLELRIDGQSVALEKVDYSPQHLRMSNLPKQFTLRVKTRIHPHRNTALEGLYKSNGKFCTQCEAEGFRRITYYQDRPDVMSTFTTTIVADKKKYPVILSNGNPTDYEELSDGRHKRTWVDPFPKPSYLFALVAGDLEVVEGSYQTRSGRDVSIRIYVEKENVDKCDFALQSVKDSMKWDEDVYGLEYDLDIFMIVAVSDFNMGAMENKGLNIFNSKYILANPKTATDRDFENIQGVVGHEYFHNWTGNRVTCRDWFQLSLKEGLTVFRDQEFSSDMNSRGIKRISDVDTLRNSQFIEDSGPLSHPVRPKSYIEINNFYTSTIYEKGAEVIRMMFTLIGEKSFYKGIHLYFERHDGQAVTIDDFVQAMSDASGVDLTQFKLWYDQAGTPRVTVKQLWDSSSQRLVLRIKQEPRCKFSSEVKAQVIPLKTALLSVDGQPQEFELEGQMCKEGVIVLQDFEREYDLGQFDNKPTLSIGRSFSAPVHLECDYSTDDYVFLMTYDSDVFNRFEAAQKLYLEIILKKARGDLDRLPESIVSAVKKIIGDQSDEAVKAYVLSMPSLNYIMSLKPVESLDEIFEARKWLGVQIGLSCISELKDTYNSLEGQARPYQYNRTSVGMRDFKLRCLQYISYADEALGGDMAINLFEHADNMSDSMAALSCLASLDHPKRTHVLESFYSDWKHDALVIDKWFMVQASSSHPSVLDHVKKLLEHSDFNLLNPNRVYSLLGRFAKANPYGFHHSSGDGYRMMADYVIKIDKKNSQVAGHLAGSLSKWVNFDVDRQGLMKEQLMRIKSIEGISKDVYEIVSKSLS